MRGWAVSTPTPSLAQLPRGSEVGAAAGVPGTQETSLWHGTDCPGRLVGSSPSRVLIARAASWPGGSGVWSSQAPASSSLSGKLCSKLNI